MKHRVVTNVSHLPMHGMATASATWWGTLAFMLLEGTGFAVAISIYLYLTSLAQQWPLRSPLPDLGPGTAVTAILVLSVIPNLMISRWARQHDLKKLRIGIIVMTIFGIVPLIVRGFEFQALNVSWDTNAYGSTVWLLLGLHTTHLLTDLIDTMVLAVIMFTRHSDNPRRYGDVHDNALYWNFVVLTWLPVYGCIYWLPRL